MVAHYIRDYPTLVDELLSTMPEDKAMATAVGSGAGNFRTVGLLERQVLTQFGFQSGDVIVDVGCGSGRLASALVEDHDGIYVGFDIVDKLVEYADRMFGRDNFHFFTCDGLKLPLDPEVADFITFFSVFTHLHHEETYLYLKDAIRILRPGGTIVCSYLDLEQNWNVFEDTAYSRERDIAAHANVFMSRPMIERLVEGAGFEVVSTFLPADRFIELPDDVELADEPTLAAGSYAFGQGICVARRPTE